MGTTIRLVLIAALLGAGSFAARGQDRPLPPPPAVLKEPEWLVGTWRHDAEGVLLHITTPMDKDSFQFKSLERRFGDQLLPDLIGIEVDRVK